MKLILCLTALFLACFVTLAVAEHSASELKSMLHAAVFEADASAVRSLLDAGASVKPIDGRHTQTALHVAAYRGLPEICRMLLDAGSNANQLMLAGEEKHRRTPLIFALHGWHETNHKLNETEAALDRLLPLPQSRYLDVVRMLVEAGANVAVKDEYSRNPLHIALQFGLKAAVAHVTSEKSCSATVPAPKAFVPNQQFGGWNALHFAANTRFRWKMFSTLLLKQRMAEEEREEELGFVSQHFVASWGTSSLPAASLSDDGLTIQREHLWPIVSAHSKALVEEVAEHCASALPDLLERTNSAYMTPLQLAVDSNDLATVKVLLEAMAAAGVAPSADPTATDAAVVLNGGNPTLYRPALHLACSRGYLELVEVLLEAADACQLDAWGRLPSDVAATEAVKEAAKAWESSHCVGHVGVPAAGVACDGGACGSPETDCDFEVVDFLDRLTFERDYLVRNKPVLVRGGVRSWPAVGKWSPSFLRDVYGRMPVRIGAIPYAGLYGEPNRVASVGEYSRYSTLVEQKQSEALMGKTPVLYVFDNEVLAGDRAPPGLLQDFSVPEVIGGRNVHPVQFMWGPQGSGAPVHYHQNAVNGVILGEKQWLLYPPTENFVSKQPAEDWFAEHGEDPRALKCTQRAGDLVFVPDSWGHAVFNTKETVALAFEFV